MIQNYQHIIWDWNGTLLDDLSLCLAIVNEMLQRRDLAQLTVERYRELFTFPIRDYYENIGFDFSRESYEQLSVQFVAAYETHWRECSLHPTVATLLERVALLGKRQSVLSALDQETLDRSVQTFKVGHLFDHLVGLDNIYAHSKLDQGRRLLGLVPQSSSEILLIGDTLHDAEVAQTIDVDCVLVAHGHQSKQRLMQSGLPVVDSLHELF